MVAPPPPYLAVCSLHVCLFAWWVTCQRDASATRSACQPNRQTCKHANCKRRGEKSRHVSRSCTIWVKYLEMRGPREVVSSPPAGVEIDPVVTVDLDLYRSIYRQVGDPWRWTARRRMDDEDLHELFRHPRHELMYLSEGDRSPAGFAELDGRAFPEIELVYFGLRERAIGRGLGGAFMRELQRRVWEHGAERFWLHTCELDHPGALAFYHHLGFETYDEKDEAPPDPNESLLW